MGCVELLDEPADITAWWDAGMRIEQATLTAELARRGTTPRMLGVVVHRRTILKRVQDDAAEIAIHELSDPHISRLPAVDILQRKRAHGISIHIERVQQPLRVDMPLIGSKI
jgi:hypothetical protein